MKIDFFILIGAFFVFGLPLIRLFLILINDVNTKIKKGIKKTSKTKERPAFLKELDKLNKIIWKEQMF